MAGGEVSLSLAPRLAHGLAVEVPALLTSIFKAVGVYLPFVVIFVVLTSDGLNGLSLVVLNSGAGLGLLYFWRKVDWSKGAYDCFGSVVLLLSVVYRFQGALEVGYRLFRPIRLQQQLSDAQIRHPVLRGKSKFFP